MTDCPPRFRERLALVIRSLRRLALATLFLGLGTWHAPQKLIHAL
jgi:hypothetical protein